jgi:hypothetical protein
MGDMGTVLLINYTTRTAMVVGNDPQQDKKLGEVMAAQKSAVPAGSGAPPVRGAK